MPFSRRQWLGAAMFAPWAIRCAYATQDAPVSMLKIINGFAAGGGADTICRRLAERLTHNGYARTAIVDLKTGAGGQIAVQSFKNAEPDGATALLIPMFTLGIYPHTYGKLSYDPFKDLAPVSMAATFDYCIAVGPAVPSDVRDLAQLVTWFKQNPSRANIGNPATGSTAHFLAVSLARATDTQISHVGYRGGQPAIMDLIAGQISAAICPIGEVIQYLKAGKCRLLATSGDVRSRFTPATPTLGELGYPKLAVRDWFGIYLPVKASTALIDRFNRAIVTAVADPEFAETLTNIGFEPTSSSPAELDAALRRDSERWGALVRQIGFRADS